MAQPNVHGRFVWQELNAKDTAASAAFYSKVIGWRTQTPPDMPDYTVFEAAGEGVAGLQPLSADARGGGARAHWLPYIGAQNVDETAAAAVRLGGKLIKAPYDLPNGGRVAEVADPQGASFGLYHASHPGAAAASPGPGPFSWQELATTDYEAAFAFYRELFGWQAMDRMNMGPSMIYLIFGWDGAQRGGIYQSTKPGGAYWLPYASVKDIEATVAAVAKAGGQVVNGPMPVPDGSRIAQLLDTNGAMFAVHSMPSQPSVSGAPKPEAPKPEAPKSEAPKPEAAKSATLRPPKSQTTSKAAAPAPTAPAAIPAPKPPTAAAVTTTAKSTAKTTAVVKKPAAPAKSAAATQPVKQPAKKAAQKPAKKAAQKPAKKAAQKPAKKPAKPKKAAKRSAAALAKKRPAPKEAAIKRGATKRSVKPAGKKAKARALKRAAAKKKAAPLARRKRSRRKK